MRFKKFVKLTDHTGACNDLTNFKSEALAKTGNGCYENMPKLVWIISSNHNAMNELILGGF
jgi:hypothetical protein